MLDRFTKRRETNAHPHDWTIAESSKRRAARGGSSNGVNTAPWIRIFRDVAIPYSLRRDVTVPPTFEVYPAPGHVGSLLLLIECFDELRSQVEDSAALKEKSHTSTGQDVDTNAWHKFVEIAIQRFKVWISNIESIIRHSAVFNRYGTGSHLHGAFTENYMPPLDVLLVWFCYLQDTPAYERLLASNDLTLLSQICFPWHVLPSVIDSSTLKYTCPPAAQALWTNILAIPHDLENCLESDLANKITAFTSNNNDMHELVLHHSDLFRRIQVYQWFRSPSLQGTIDRALARYGKAIVVGHLDNTRQTQQIPDEHSEESRSIADFDMDIAMKAVLLTHRGYHDAWRMFSRVYNIHHDEQAPPPSYDCIMSIKQKSSEDVVGVGRGRPALSECFCWVCERVKDEVEAEDLATDGMTTLEPVESPELMDEKLSVLSRSSSSSDSVDQDDLGLSRKQVKQIKRDVHVYRAIEAKRLKSMKNGRSVTL